jgi:hypothetical protein
MCALTAHTGPDSPGAVVLTRGRTVTETFVI